MPLRPLLSRIANSPKCLIAICVILAFLVWRIGHHGASEQMDHAQHKFTPSAKPLPYATITNNAEVFQKAFWKRPTDEDHILNAERREWSGEDGITHWQWFIAVNPSPQIMAHIWEGNSFGLVLTNRAALENSPTWFPKAASDFEVRHSPHGKMTLLWNRRDNILYGTDEGGGFESGAPAPLEQPTSQKPPSNGDHRVPPESRPILKPRQ